MSNKNRPEGAIQESAPVKLGSAELYQAVRALPTPEQLQFLVAMSRDKDTPIGQFFRTLVKKVTRSTEEVQALFEKLKRHRKPKKNVARDAEIMRLRGGGKTAGQIVLALKGRYQLTDKSVNAVISRERRKRKAD